ncbi:uncharacterized protein LOC142497744 [Ascaphus truei]|uniref:uncharacterized protein LOC142497744 n=1 Tax=Ascaphus truei TaxID=8439 RepID=UPI003F5A49B6
MEEPDVATQGQIHSSDHKDVDTPGLTQHSSPPARDTYSAIAASEERILGVENPRHSEMMSVLERMISLHERMHGRSISQMSQIQKVIIQVPKEIQNGNRTLQALVVNLSQANQLRMTAREQQFNFTPSEDGSLHAATFSPESSVLPSPVRDDTGTVGASSVQVPLNIEPLTSVQNLEQIPTNETRKRKLGQQLLLTSFWKKIKTPKQETAPPSLLQCLSSASQLPQPTPSAPELQQPTPSAPDVQQATPSAPEVQQPTLSATEVQQATPSAPEVQQPTPSAPEVQQATPSAPELQQPTPSAPEVQQATPSAPEVQQPTPSATELPQASTSHTVKAKVLGKGKRQTQQPTSRPVTRSQKDKQK